MDEQRLDKAKADGSNPFSSTNNGVLSVMVSTKDCGSFSKSSNLLVHPKIVWPSG